VVLGASTEVYRVIRVLVKSNEYGSGSTLGEGGFT
jgi:hypothetical protein